MNIAWYEDLFSSLEPDNRNWIDKFRKTIKSKIENPSHGDYNVWRNAVKTITDFKTTTYDFSGSTIMVGDFIEASQRAIVHDALQKLIPWRKGPFQLHGISIDSEWQSNLKWDRLCNHLPALENKTVLDIGCGNGYYMLRLLGAGAQQVVGIDPSLLFMCQFYSIAKSINEIINAHYLPLRMEELCMEGIQFDIVLSMGVLYHRHTPSDHLQQLFSQTGNNGEVFIETLILDTAETTALEPDDRYAGMRNVWCIPSPSLVIEWLQCAGFTHCKVVNKQSTTTSEQRSTPWMPTFSLQNFLHPDDNSKTIEGYPAPVRAIFSARKN